MYQRQAGGKLASFVLSITSLELGPRPLGTLSKLRKVHLAQWFSRDFSRKTNFIIAEIFLGLGALRETTLTDFQERRGCLTWKFPVGIPNIKKLQLHKCNITSSLLAAVFKSCNNLEEIRISWDGCPIAYHAEEEFEINVDYPQLRTSLLRHAKTLRVLALDTMSDGGTYTRYTAGIGSMQVFRRLERLEIDDSILCGDTDDSLWLKREDTDEVLFRLSGFFPPCLKSFKLHSSRGFEVLGKVLRAVITNASTTLQHLAITRALLVDRADEQHMQILDGIQETLRPFVRWNCHPAFAHDILIFDLPTSDCPDITFHKQVEKLAGMLDKEEEMLEREAEDDL